jgi:protein phosphatase
VRKQAAPLGLATAKGADGSELVSLDPDALPDVAQVFLLSDDRVEPDEVTLPSVRIVLSASGDSDAGKKRARNEDSFLLSANHSLFAVADGMGGHRGGKEASSLALETLERAFDEVSFDDEFMSDAPLPNRGRELATALVKANDAVLRAARAEPALAEMGTTLVAARFSRKKPRVYIAHVGDSRCYRFRASRLTQLTMDHTMRHLGLQGPHASDLSRAIGIERNVQIDLVVDVPCADDIYLLCSDGLSKMVSDQEIERVLQSASDGDSELEAAVYRLIELANDAGGRDNVTVILVSVDGDLPRDNSAGTTRAPLAGPSGTPPQMPPRKRAPGNGAQ